MRQSLAFSSEPQLCLSYQCCQSYQWSPRGGGVDLWHAFVVHVPLFVIRSKFFKPSLKIRRFRICVVEWRCVEYYTRKGIYVVAALTLTRVQGLYNCKTGQFSWAMYTTSFVSSVVASNCSRHIIKYESADVRISFLFPRINKYCLKFFVSWITFQF